jgi:hypothetical protein
MTAKKMDLSGIGNLTRVHCQGLSLVIFRKKLGIRRLAVDDTKQGEL